MQFEKLLNVCDVYQPKTISTKNFVTNGKYFVYGANGIIGRYNEYNHEYEEVLLGCRGACGSIHLSKPFSWINGNAMVVTPKNKTEIDKKYLAYCLMSVNKDTIITGTAQPQITRTNLVNFEIPICELPEQQRIVAKIEELFAELDNSVAMLKKVKEQMEVYRQAVLQAVFGNKKYETVRICQFADVGTGATPLKSNANYYGGEIPWVNSSKVNEEYIYTASDFITELAIKETNCKIYPIGTLLMAMYGEGKTRGKCAELKIAATTNQAVAAIVLKKDTCILKDFLKLYLLYNYQGIRRKSSGGVQPNINLNIVKNLTIPLYDKGMQKELVKKIKEVFAKCDCLENSVDTSLQQADALRQSILKKAFGGEL